MKSPNDPWATFKAHYKQFSDDYPALGPMDIDARVMQLWEMRNEALMTEMAQKMKGESCGHQ